LGEFISDQEEWTSYVERLQQYFTANNIISKQKQRAVFISSCGVSTYRLIKNLLAPRAPSEVEFDDIISTVTTHCQPPPSEIMQKYRFNTCVRRPHETISTYLANLKQIAKHCNFGDSLPQMLRDRLACGIGDEHWKKRLLSEEKLTYDQAVKILRTMETAEQDVKDVSTQKSSIHQILSRPKPSGLQRRSQSSESATYSTSPTCYRCGGPHKAPECYLKDVLCNYCHKKGHVQRVCRKKSMASKGAMNLVTEASTHDEAQSLEYPLFNMAGMTRAYVVEVTLNEVNVPMEIDTGAALSIMSKTTYEQLWHEGGPKVHATQIRLKSYDSSEIIVEGEISVLVKYGVQRAQLPLVVVSGHDPSLLGRNWLQHLKLDWSSLQHFQDSNDLELQTIIKKHEELFAKDLGKLVNGTAKIYLKKNAKPRYCHAQPVPYSLRAKVETEIEQLVNSGVLEPVKFSEWAAPVVPVVKRERLLLTHIPYQELQISLHP